MLINDITLDTKSLLDRECLTQQSVADSMGLLKASICRTINSGRICDGWINIIEAIGYDVKITYIKRHIN